ncbi:MAG: glutamine synthetase beta-grasp domain-containing protein [Candidatus Dasytiphilus stammeri]
MSDDQFFRMVKKEEVKFIDLRFTDIQGKEQHVTIPSHQVNDDLFNEGKKCLMYFLS